MIVLGNNARYDLHLLISPTVKDVLKFITQGDTVEKIFEYYEKMYPGIFHEYITIYIQQAFDFIASVIVLNEENRNILSNPQAYFHTDDPDELRTFITAHFIEFIHKDSEPYLKQAMIAIIEYALGNATSASNACGFAQNEFDVKDFNHYMAQNNEIATQALLDEEEKKAAIFVFLLLKYRSQ